MIVAGGILLNVNDVGLAPLAISERVPAKEGAPTVPLAGFGAVKAKLG